VIFWQWINQSFNAIVNYTNRSGSNPIPSETLTRSYVGATGGAVLTALTLNRLAQRGPPLAGRLVPLAAVAAANCVNIPLMRITELQNGIELQTADGVKVGQSKRAAKQAIASVTLSRILMASPSMSRFHRVLMDRIFHSIDLSLLIFVYVKRSSLFLHCCSFAINRIRAMFIDSMTPVCAVVLVSWMRTGTISRFDVDSKKLLWNYHN